MDSEAEPSICRMPIKWCFESHMTTFYTYPDQTPNREMDCYCLIITTPVKELSIPLPLLGCTIFGGFWH